METITPDEYRRLLEDAIVDHRRQVDLEIEHIEQVRAAVPDVAVELTLRRDMAVLLYTRTVSRTDHALFETVRGACDGYSHDPAMVYAIPCVPIGGRLVRYVKGYAIATLTGTVLEPERGWRETMDRDGVPPVVVAHVAAFLSVSVDRRSWGPC
jgi:hypothetical protein